MSNRNTKESDRVQSHSAHGGNQTKQTRPSGRKHPTRKGGKHPVAKALVAGIAVFSAAQVNANINPDRVSDRAALVQRAALDRTDVSREQFNLGFACRAGEFRQAEARTDKQFDLDLRDQESRSQNRDGVQRIDRARFREEFDQRAERAVERVRLANREGERRTAEVNLAFNDGFESNFQRDVIAR